jgi:uncharacterized protein (DUF1501 family)
MTTPAHVHRAGMNRREMMQVGYSALLGLSAAGSFATAAGSTKKLKQVILVFQTGAASHIDTFDPKPDAPVEIRGEFKTIQTKTPGLLATEHLPLLAARSDKYAVVRTLSHADNNHTAATHHIITGAKQPGVRFDKPLSRDDFPCFAAAASALKPAKPGIPSGVVLPTFLGEGPLVWPGQHAGFLGPKHDPWHIRQDPNLPTFRVDDAHLAQGLDVQQIENRQSLLGDLNKQQRMMAASAESKRLTDQQEKAFSLLTSGAVAKAFDISKESDKTRDRYGRHMFGQSLLLAKRLNAAGVPVVQANMGRVQNWDTHGKNFERLKKDLLPPLDMGVSALLDDLAESGKLEETLVIVVGDFGRTPKVDAKNGGRDHWAPCFCGLFAGAGVRGGQVVGRSDSTAAYPVTQAYSPDDLGATVYEALGIDPSVAEVKDRLDRPVQLNRGTPIRALYS